MSNPRLRRIGVRIGATAAVATLCGLSAPGALADPAPSGAASSLGGWQLSASAAPVTIEFFDPKIPIPAQPGKPNLEFDFSYTRANYNSGPSGGATASWLWPGDALAFGLPTFLNNPNANYPVIANVSYPGQVSDKTLQPINGSYMSSHSDANGSTAVSTFGLPLPGTGPGSNPTAAPSPSPSPSTSSPASPLGGLLGGGLPAAPQLPDAAALASFLASGGPLVDAEGERSHSVATVTGNTATAGADTEVGTLSILGGLIKFDNLKVEATSASEGAKGTASGVVAYGSMTVAGQTFAITSNGIVTPNGPIAVPQLPDAVNTLLAPIGITFTQPAASDLSKDTQGQMSGHGMQITIDTSVLKKMSPNNQALKDLIGQIPPQVMAQLPAQLTPIISALPDMSPTIVITVGVAKSQAIASPPIDLSGASPTGGATQAAGQTTGGTSGSVTSSTGGTSTTGGAASSGGSFSADTSGGSTSGTSGATGSSGTGGATSGGTSPQAQSQHAVPAAFGGLPGQLTAAALVLAAAAAWAIRKYSTLLFGGTGCELGHGTAIPNLREELEP